jgi:tetratricopeptide (TPR) repeat protein
VCFFVLLVAVAGCSKDPERAKREYLKSGNRYYSQKKYAEAIVQYRSALQQDPQFGDARYRLAEAYEQVGDVGAAYKEAVRAADLLPQRVDAQLKAAVYLLLTRQFEDAKTRADRAIALDPKNANAYIVRGNALAGLNDFKAGIRQLQEAITLEPSANAYVSLGMLLNSSGSRPEAEDAFRRAVAVAPEAVAPHLALANYLWSSGRAADAEGSLKTALRLEPDNLQALNALATLYMAMRRPLDAEPYLIKVADLDPTPEGKLTLADFYVAGNLQDKARPVLERAASTRDGFAPARSRLAMLQYANGQTLQAHKTIDDVLAKQPQFVRALVAKAFFLGQEKKFDAALERARAAVAAENTSAQAYYVVGLLELERRNRQEAIKAFNEVLRINPRAVSAQLRLAQLYLTSGATDVALQFAESAAKNAPQDPNVEIVLARTLIARRDLAHAETVVGKLLKDNPQSSAVHALAGSLAGAQGDKGAARRAYGRALELDGGNVEALTNVTALDLEAGNQVEAANRLDVRLARAPNDPATLILAARFRATLGENGEAERLLRSAIEVDPVSLPAYGLLGHVYLRENRIADARRTFETMATRDPSSVQAHTMVAMLHEMENNTSEARRRYEKVLELDPRAAVAANNLACIYADDGGNLDLAVQLAQTAKQRLPEAPEVNDTLGWVYYKKDLVALAIRPLEDAASAQPKNAIFQYHLGMAYIKVGEKAKGRRALERALSLEPGMRQAGNVRAALAAM